MRVRRQPSYGGLPSAVNVDGAGVDDSPVDDGGPVNDDGAVGGVGVNDGAVDNHVIDNRAGGGAGKSVVQGVGLAHPQVPLWKAVTGVVSGSVLATALGTVLHAQIFHAEGFDAPWGAFAALVFSCSVAVLMGLWAGRVWFAAATGALTYVLTGILATTAGSTPLIVTGYEGMEHSALSLAGNIWIIGQAVATIAAVVITSLCLRRSQPGEPAKLP